VARATVSQWQNRQLTAKYAYFNPEEKRAPRTERERERGREPPKGIQLQQTTTTTDSGGVLLGLILGINHTHTSAPHTITWTLGSLSALFVILQLVSISAIEPLRHGRGEESERGESRAWKRCCSSSTSFHDLWPPASIMFVITFEQIIVLVFSCTHFLQFVLLSLDSTISLANPVPSFLFRVRVLNEIQ